jgi:hypothetical protein
MGVIYANALNISGKLQNMSLYTNTMGTNGYSNIVVEDSLHVQGSVFTSGRMDVGNTIFATFRLNSNLPFSNNVTELRAASNTFTMDFTSTDMSGMMGIPMTVPSSNVFNQATGVVTVPVNGLYNLEMQGHFENDPAKTNVENGVYYYFINHPHPAARVQAHMTSGDLVSTSHTTFLLAGDKFVPTFYSNDSNARLVPGNGETYVSFSVAATVTPTHSNYVRLPV